MENSSTQCSPRYRGIKALYNVPAPAKINWFLRVLGRREDGYHELQTVFQFIDWCDWLDFERRDDGMISRIGGEDNLPAEDLSIRAARLLQQHAGCPYGVEIHLRKSIPAQAGLGGGSSDAATTLLALNRLWGLNLPRAELQALGAQLGADVPVFVYGSNAFAEGVGDKLSAIDLPTWNLLVAWPGKGLSTAEVFGSPFLTKSSRTETISGFARFAVQAGVAWRRLSSAAVAKEALAGFEGFGKNDLLGAARAALPEIGRAGAWLLEKTGSGLVAMSGSGSAMFSPCDPSQQPIVAAAPDSWVVRKCVALAGHPLRDWVA